MTDDHGDVRLCPACRFRFILLLKDIASLGNPDWSNPSVAYSLGTPDGQFGPSFSSRGVVKGSPVVPGSTQKVLEDGDQCLYTVTLLRGQYQVRVLRMGKIPSIWLFRDIVGLGGFPLGDDVDCCLWADIGALQIPCLSTWSRYQRQIVRRKKRSLHAVSAPAAAMLNANRCFIYPGGFPRR